MEHTLAQARYAPFAMSHEIPLRPVPLRRGAPAIDLPEPGSEERAHSERLQAQIRDTIDMAGGWISFRHFMELALYAPMLGYYVAGARKFGREGDFVTAPEVSPLFSRCLARQCAQVLEALDGGDILEFGAGTGLMAVDLLAELERVGRLPERYLILELSPELKARQRETLAARVPDLLARVHWIERLPAAPIRGVILGNEVLDAMPVQLFALHSAGIMERGVGVGAGGAFAWQEQPADEPLRARVTHLLEDLPHALVPGYCSELNPNLEGWMQSVADALAAGAVLLVDYGYPRHEYYSPERDEGTLLCHYRHRAHPDPFFWPGLQDITANVDFTAVAEAGTQAGLTLAGYTTQANFLIGCGLDAVYQQALAAAPDDLYRLSQQVQRLTLPGEMGDRFYAIGFTHGLDLPLAGFSVRDLCNRL